MLLLEQRPGMVIEIEGPDGALILIHLSPREGRIREFGIEAPSAFTIRRIKPGVDFRTDWKRRVDEGNLKRRIMNPPGGSEFQRLRQKAAEAKTEMAD